MNFVDKSETKRVLIVDDEPSLRDLFAVALMEDTREILTCSDGFTALRALRESGFDLVLLDLSLPDTNGIHILREMRRRGDSTAVILCSAHVNEGAFLAAMELGVSKFVAKPVTLEAIRKIVNSVIGDLPDGSGSALDFAEKFNFSDRARILAGSNLEQKRRSC